MSEYQYYEFQAIDRPLTPKEMDELRTISSRAEITPRGLTNEYHFGDFRGKPLDLMKKYFDAFLYYANWGTHKLMLRVPASALPDDVLAPYLGECFNAHPSGDRLILHFEDGLEDGGWGTAVDGSRWLEIMLPVRDDLIAGDRRALYLGWLGGVQFCHVEDDEAEPPVPAGLQALSPALEQLADFLYIDAGLLAAELSPDLPGASPSAEHATWVARLPPGEKDAYLVQLLQGDATTVRGELRRRFLVDTAPAPRVATTPRTAGQLRAAAEVWEEAAARRRAEQAAREKAHRDAEAARARAVYLAGLTGKEEQLWQEAEAAVTAKAARAYDRAVQILIELRDLAARDGQADAFAARVRALRQRHSTKRTFIDRVNKAGLPS